MITNETKMKVDELGRVLADKADLLKREKELKRDLRATGERVIEGFLFRATLSPNVRKVLNMTAVRAKLSRQFITANTEERVGEDTVRVVARNGAEVKAA